MDTKSKQPVRRSHICDKTE